MIPVQEIRNKLAAVANDQLSLFDFIDWVDSSSWSMYRDASRDAIKLVSSIDRLAAEYDHHDVSESELRSRVLQLLNNIHDSIRQPVAASIVPPQQIEWRYSGAPARVIAIGRLPVQASA
jgi:hypothetical protein